MLVQEILTTAEKHNDPIIALVTALLSLLQVETKLNNVITVYISKLGDKMNAHLQSAGRQSKLDETS